MPGAHLPLDPPARGPRGRIWAGPRSTRRRPFGRILRASRRGLQRTSRTVCPQGKAAVVAQHLRAVSGKYRSQQIRNGNPCDAVFGHDTGLTCHELPSQGGTDERPQDVVARGLDYGGTGPTGATPPLYDHLPGPGPAVSGDRGGRRRAAAGRGRPIGGLDREARAQVGPAIPEESSRRVARSSRARPQAGHFPPRWRCTS